MADAGVDGLEQVRPLLLLERRLAVLVKRRRFLEARQAAHALSGQLTRVANDGDGTYLRLLRGGTKL